MNTDYRDGIMSERNSVVLSHGHVVTSNKERTAQGTEERFSDDG